MEGDRADTLEGGCQLRRGCGGGGEEGAMGAREQLVPETGADED